MDLFETVDKVHGYGDGDGDVSKEDVTRRPLSEALRPTDFSGFFGQEKVLGRSSYLYKILKNGEVPPSLILWGPPGTGKTTFARILSTQIKAHFISVNAVDTGAKELRAMGVEAQTRRLMNQDRTILFVDEIHRLNKAQQDVLLPFTEKGDLILVGATTENPSYELNSAVLSRCRVVVFERLGLKNLKEILLTACGKLNLKREDLVTDAAMEDLISLSDGDARKLLNNFEFLVRHHLSKSEPLEVGENDSEKSKPSQAPLSSDDLRELMPQNFLKYDKNGEEHYNVVSAFIKSIRGSHPDAAIYYLARMLVSGEDPVFIARRLVISASEDIGNADPKALSLAVAGLQAVELVGMPEARISLAQVTTYLASAPKSNRSYEAINKAVDYVKKTGSLEVPMHLRNSRTKLSKEVGYGKGYKYSHDYPKAYVKQSYLPEGAESEEFYKPSVTGFEKNIRQYLSWLKGESSESKP